MIVIGGGDTGTDCVGTAMRHGCRSLVQFEILPRPPEDRAEDNPWPEWPRVYKMDYGQEEAAAKFGSDPRVYLTTIKRFIADDQSGKLSAIVTVDIRWEQTATGGHAPVEVPGFEKRPCLPSSCCSRWGSSAPRPACCRKWAWSSTTAAT